MKLLAFAATNNSQSINKALVSYATELVNAEAEILDLNDYEMPIYSADREQQNGIPDLAKQLFSKFGQADAIVISFAEYNGSYTAAFKNIFDWVSRIDRKLYQNKPMVLMAASPGPGGAKNVLASAVESTPHFAGQVKAHVSVANFYDNFDMQAGQVTEPSIQSQIQQAMNILVA
jgi:NAD(P)H-dependent FMN reductase